MLFLFAAGVVAGALNAVGGGGTFIALPALVAAGLPAVTANASATVALLPGAAASAWAYRHDVAPLGTTSMGALTATSVVGGGLGAGLLIVLPSTSFEAAVPWLLAFATVVLAGGRALSARLARRRFALGAGSVLVGQLLLAVYGGYFGGAVGILMLAVWSIGLGVDAATGNPQRVTQLAAVYAAAAAVFLATTDILDDPGPVAAVLTGSIGGGLIGARVARRLSAPVLRGVVLAVATTMTVLYAVR